MARILRPKESSVIQVQGSHSPAGGSVRPTPSLQPELHDQAMSPHPASKSKIENPSQRAGVLYFCVSALFYAASGNFWRVVSPSGQEIRSLGSFQLLVVARGT